MQQLQPVHAFQVCGLQHARVLNMPSHQLCIGCSVLKGVSGHPWLHVVTLADVALGWVW